MATIQSQPAPYIMPTTYAPAPVVTDHRRYSISSAVTSPASPSPSAQLPAPSKPVRHVPHSPSFRQLPFAGMPRSASPVTSVQPQAPPAGQAYLPQQSQRYRMGHHRSEISLSASGRSVSMPVSSSSAYSSPSPSPTASSSSSAISHSRSNSVASTSSSSSPTVLDQTYTYNAPPTRPTLPYSNSFSHPPQQQQQQQQSHSPIYAPDQSYYQYQRQSMASASVPRSLSRASTAAYNMARTSSPVRQPLSRPASVRSFSAPEEHSQLRYNSSSTSLSSMSSSPKPSSSSSSSSSTASRTREMSTASARQQHSRQPSTDSVATTVSTSSTSSKTHRRNASSSTVSDYERKKALKNLETSPTDQDRLGPRFANDDKETKKKSRFKKMLSFIAPQQQSSTTAPVYGPPTPVSYIVTSTSTSPVSTKSMNSSIPAPSRTSSHDSRRSSRAVDSVDVMEYNFLNESIYKKQATAGSQQEAEDDDDNTSIRSTASSVSKALRRFSTGLSSRRPSKVSSMSSLNNGSSSNSSSTASSVRDSVVIADEGEDDDDASQYETVRMYEPVKNPAVIPKSILKNPHQGQQVPTPSVSPAASDASDSSDSTSSGMTQESFANSHSSSWTSLALSNNSPSPTCNEDSVKEAAKPSTKEEGAAVQFSPNIRIYSTWNSGEYDRKIPDPVPYHTFPMWMISQIKEEINNYKSNEMEIHEESKCFTCYY